LRNAGNVTVDETDRLSATLDKNIEYLDIPAFLRREDKAEIK
jgi:hypothetical protein